MVVECHGSMHRPETLVLYGDPLPSHFSVRVNEDFDDSMSKVDLVLVMGTSLQVAPFCCLPNIAPRGSTRVLVNRRIDHCLKNGFSSSKPELLVADGGGRVVTKTMSIGRRKHIKLESMWTGREGRKRWRQLLVESDCDEFVRRYQNQTGEEISLAFGGNITGDMDGGSTTP